MLGGIQALSAGYSRLLKGLNQEEIVKIVFRLDLLEERGF